MQPFKRQKTSELSDALPFSSSSSFSTFSSPSRSLCLHSCARHPNLKSNANRHNARLRPHKQCNPQCPGFKFVSCSFVVFGSRCVKALRELQVSRQTARINSSSAAIASGLSFIERSFHECFRFDPEQTSSRCFMFFQQFSHAIVLRMRLVPS